jgi:hypothetical protein
MGKIIIWVFVEIQKIFPAARTAGTLIRRLRRHLPPREGIWPVRFRIGVPEIAAWCRTSFVTASPRHLPQRGRFLAWRRFSNFEVRRGDYQSPAVRGGNLENLSRGKDCRYPHPSPSAPPSISGLRAALRAVGLRNAPAGAAPGKVFSGYVFALVLAILQIPAAGRLIIAPTDFGFWKSVRYQILQFVGGDAHIAPRARVLNFAAERPSLGGKVARRQP